MKNWSFSKKVGSAPRFLSFESSQQDHLLPSNVFTSRSDDDDQNRRTHYNNSVQVSPCLEIRSSSIPIGSPPGQLTVFYAGSVSVYEDISPEKADAIMLLAGNGPQAQVKPIHHSHATIGSPTFPPSFMPSTSYIFSETGSGSNGVIGLGATKKMLSLSSKPQNNQSEASIMAPSVTVCLPQARKASLTRFLEKRKERFINISPYFVDNKSQQTVEHQRLNL